MKTPASDRKAPRTRTVLAIVALLALGTVAVAQDGGQALTVDRDDSVERDVVRASLARPGDMKPLIPGGLDPRIRGRLNVAFRLAAERVSGLPTCAALFADLGAEGLERLRATRYQSVADTGGARVCGRGLGAAAFTLVNSPRTIVCPSFERLTVEEAAVIVIHEALHFSGQTEWPRDPDAPNGGQINRMVRVACGL